MGNNEHYFFHIKYKLEKHWNQIVVQPGALPPNCLDLMSCVSAQPCEDLDSFQCTPTQSSAALWEEDHTHINNDASVSC